jgi:hypothetical protein
MELKKGAYANFLAYTESIKIDNARSMSKKDVIMAVLKKRCIDELRIILLLILLLYITIKLL